GLKAKSLIKNIGDIKRMMWILLNQDCITIYNYINDLRTNDMNETFSIFKYCDEHTTKLIDKFF
ncbi:hypothetical protein M2T37_28000, partial [Klebsiella pneumoniae]|uniref:hypothetical protein n=1 Tax=Klebsiella pneumoniae TaxID=573 RepID=UPI00200F906E